MLCYGNICRSPYAAGLIRAAALPGLVVREGGFFGPDRPSPDTARSVASERGHNLESHRSRLVTLEDLQWADLIIVMESGHSRRVRRALGHDTDALLLLGDLDPEPIERRPIRDPYGGSPTEFHRAFARIERCVKALVEALRSPADGRSQASSM